MASPIVFTKTLGSASATNIALSQSPGTAAFTLNGSTVSGGVATIDAKTATNSAIGRRVIITSGSDDSGISFVVTGTNSTGNAITDTFAGTNGGAAQSNQDFVTVTGITSTGAGAAGTVTAGTNGVGSSPWNTLNWHVTSVMNVSVGIEIVTGSVNYSVQHTYDDPNRLLAGAAFPFPYVATGFLALTASADGVFELPIAAVNVLINSGTGTLRVRILQSGIG